MNERYATGTEEERNAAIDAASLAVQRGGLVVLPTDTVYGIACDLGAPGGVERLFTAKSRPADRAIMLLLADASQAPAIGVVGPAAREVPGSDAHVAHHPGCALESIARSAVVVGR